MPFTATRSVAPFAAAPTADRNDDWEIVVFQNDSYFDTQFSQGVTGPPRQFFPPSLRGTSHQRRRKSRSVGRALGCPARVTRPTRPPGPAGAPRRPRAAAERRSDRRPSRSRRCAPARSPWMLPLTLPRTTTAFADNSALALPVEPTTCCGSSIVPSTWPSTTRSSSPLTSPSMTTPCPIVAVLSGAMRPAGTLSARHRWSADRSIVSKLCLDHLKRPSVHPAGRIPFMRRRPLPNLHSSPPALCETTSSAPAAADARRSRTASYSPGTPPPPSPDAPETPPADAHREAADRSRLHRQAHDVVRPRRRRQPAEDVAGVPAPSGPPRSAR